MKRGQRIYAHDTRPQYWEDESDDEFVDLSKFFQQAAFIRTLRSARINHPVVDPPYQLPPKVRNYKTGYFKPSPYIKGASNPRITSYWLAFIKLFFNVDFSSDTEIRLDSLPFEKDAILEKAWDLRPDASAIFDPTVSNYVITSDKTEYIHLETGEPGKEYSAYYRIEYIASSQSVKITFESTAPRKEIDSKSIKLLERPAHFYIQEAVDAEKKWPFKKQILRTDYQNTFPRINDNTEIENFQHEYFKGIPGPGIDKQAIRHQRDILVAFLQNKLNKFEYAKNPVDYVEHVDEIINIDGVRFRVSADFKYDNSNDWYNHHYTRHYPDNIKIEYLHDIPQTSYDRYTVSQPAIKDAIKVSEIQFYRRNPDLKERVEIHGLENITEKDERYTIHDLAFNIAYEHFYSGKAIPTIRDSQINQQVQIKEEKDGKEIVSTYYYQFIIGKGYPENNGVLDIYVKRLGKAGEEVADIYQLRVQDDITFPASVSPAVIHEWLNKHYKGLLTYNYQEGITTVDELLQQANRSYNDHRMNAAWFKDMYTITLITPANRNRATLPDGVTGLKEFTEKELLTLEKSFQKMDPEIRKKTIVNTFFYRAEKIVRSDGSIASVTGLTDYDNNTIGFFDAGYYSFLGTADNPENLLAQGRQVSLTPEESMTSTHEMGHKIAHLPTGSGVKVQRLDRYDNPYQDDERYLDRFNDFVNNILGKEAYSAIPVGTEVHITPPTSYSRGELSNATTSTIIISDEEYRRRKVETEFFPEAYAIFTHEPEFLASNLPQVYIWFLYLNRTDSVTTLEKMTDLVNLWKEFEQEKGYEARKKEELDKMFAFLTPAYRGNLQLKTPAGRKSIINTTFPN